jgi:hypothetical protein
MATQYANGKIVTSGLVLALDAADKNSYPGSGTTWRDLAGNNTNTLTNSPTFSNTNGGSIIFDGVDDYIDCNLDVSWNNTNSNTIIIVLTPGNQTQSRGFIGKGPANWEWQLNQIGTGLELVYWNTGGGHTNGPITTISNVFQSNIPVFIGLVWDNLNNQHYFYKNGVNVGSNTWTNASINQNRSDGIKIGGAIYAWGMGGSYWAGSIHSVFNYNRALSATEISQNYNAQKSRFNL